MRMKIFKRQIIFFPKQFFATKDRFKKWLFWNWIFCPSRKKWFQAKRLETFGPIFHPKLDA